MAANQKSFCFSLPFKDMYYASVKALYTVGYSTSLVSLTTAMVILCRFRSVLKQCCHTTLTFLYFQYNINIEYIQM